MGGATILLLVKDWKTRILARAQLLEEGFDVIALDDAAEARARVLGGETMDLVVVDGAGWSEGTEAAAWIRRLRPAIPMLILGHGWDEVEGGGGAVGSRTERLARPFSIGDLVDRVRCLVRP